MPKHTDITYLYRIENPNISAKPDGAISHEDIIGQWFSPNAAKVVQYLKKSQKVPGAQLVVAELPTISVNDFHVSKHPIAATMDVEDDNYLLPRDGTISTVTIPLDGLVSDLNPNNVRERLEAVERIRSQLGELSLIN